MNRFKKFILNGLMLTAVSLMMRGIGVSFNVYISNKVGAEAMGLFTLISTVYSFAITVATSGINLAATRLVSEALGELSTAGIRINGGKTDSVRAVMKKCFSYALFFSIASALALFLFAPAISVRILKDERCISSLRLLAVTLPPIAVSSALSGYFTALRKVYKNALTQITEQFIKIAASAYLLTFFFGGGVESACVCVVLGGVIAEVLSFIVHTILYFAEKREPSENEKLLPNPRLIGSKLRGIALPVAFSAYLRSGLVTIEHILIPWGLERSGSSRALSLAAYGTVHSMVFPIVFFPSAILSSFAGLLVPEVAQANSEKKYTDIEKIVSNVFETALIFAIGTAGIMICFSYELGNIIYPGTDAGKYIKMIAPLIPVMYLDTAVDSMLKGLGEQVYSMGVNIVDSLLSVVLVVILLPAFGIDGYIMTVYFTEIVNATLSITRLLNVSKIKPYVVGRVVKPLVCVIIASSIIKYIAEFLPVSFPSMTFEAVVSISCTAALYLVFLFFCGSLKKRKIKKAVKLLTSK
ncbi:MAG: polysaccharide biosynthesis protein [Clostridia bacterium]|nr:polysaccharide biosynthesis protein [Clostridia bacterium]